jgi:hypothetical protein
VAEKTMHDELLQRAADLIASSTTRYRVQDADTWLQDYRAYREAPTEGTWEWVPETLPAWEVLAEPDQEHLCRGTNNCPGRPVARINRSRNPDSPARWFLYCEDHLYGRRIVDGVLQVRRVVAAEPTS